MLLSKVVAKKKEEKEVFQSLEGHTIDAMLILKDYIIKNQVSLKRFCKDFSLEYDFFCSLVFLSIYLHDLGKITLEFQNKIRADKHTGDVAHSFFGLPFIRSNLPDDLDIIMKLVILSHHTQLYNQIYQNANLKTQVTYLKKSIREYIEKARDIYYQEFKSIFNLQYYPQYEESHYLSNIELNETIKEEEIAYLKHRQERNFKTVKTKAIYSLLLSILKHCDQKASKNFVDMELNDKKIYSSLLILKEAHKFNYSREIFNINKNKLFIQPFEYQKNALKIDFNGIIFAPCGRGKTEAALYAALNIIKKNKRNRIIFALPTQITSNAMYRRMGEIFDKKNVGIYHGLSRYIHFENNEMKDEEAKELIRDERVFNKPVIVTTVDHLIYSLVHGYKQSDYAFGNILNSIIIFDEIHYYEKHTLRYILDAIKILKKLSIPHITMSGTFPDFLISILNKDSEYNVIIDKIGLTFKPFLIEIVNNSISSAIGKILDFYKKRKRQIVIVNTVKRAQQLYKEIHNSLKQNNIILYHSIFTHYDRAYSRDSKEKKILALNYSKDPWIIVSTQAIEISVDVSCDIMHTELAPVDAIGQRGGRLNRGGEYHNNCYTMYIYPTENHKPYYFGDEGGEDFVTKTNNVVADGEVSYEKLKNWVDKVYKDVKLMGTNLENIFKDCILFGYSPREIRYSEEEGNVVQIRRETFIKTNIVPEKYWAMYRLKDNPNQISRFEVKIPYFWCRKYNDQVYLEEDKYNNKHLISTISYTPDYGFDLDGIKEVDTDCLMF